MLVVLVLLRLCDLLFLLVLQKEFNMDAPTPIMDRYASRRRFDIDRLDEEVIYWGGVDRGWGGDIIIVGGILLLPSASGLEKNAFPFHCRFCGKHRFWDHWSITSTSTTTTATNNNTSVSISMRYRSLGKSSASVSWRI